MEKTQLSILLFGNIPCVLFSLALFFVECLLRQGCNKIHISIVKQPMVGHVFCFQPTKITWA